MRKQYVKAVLRSPYGTELEGWLDPAGHELKAWSKVQLTGTTGTYTITGLGAPQDLPKGASYFTVTRKVS